MTEYHFIHNDNNIKFTIDLLGRENVFANGELIAKSTYSLSSVKKYEFQIDGDLLTLTRYIASYERAECQVSLSNSLKVIDKQAKLLIGLSSDGSEITFDEHEYEWLKEINLPARATSLGWIMYLLVILQSFTLDIFNSPATSQALGWSIVALFLVSVGMFFVAGFKEVFRDTSKLSTDTNS